MMTYDVERQRVVLFGGCCTASSVVGTGSGAFPDTWEWDGTCWTQRATTGPASGTGAMVYDAARQRVVLFGGGLTGETWEWDGVSWTKRTPANSPSARFDHAMAYDAARQRVVLFGGASLFNPNATRETWEWDGTDWAQRSGRSVTYGRAGHAMAYDAARQRVVLAGGINSCSVFRRCYNVETWEWDGSNWSRRGLTGSRPTARRLHAMTYDEARQRVVLHGGVDAYRTRGDTWEWDGSYWNQRASIGPGRYRHKMVWDAARQRVVTFGGSYINRNYNDTWEWDGSAWAQRRPSGGPPSLDHLAMAYDARRGRVVTFGGSVKTMAARNGYPFSETWEWDGVRWAESSPRSAIPPERVHHALAYDAARQRIVMFGGLADAISPAPAADTWVWDGADWIQSSPAVSPPARYSHGLAYDAARQRVVLFGGFDTAEFFSDTWQWDGASWRTSHPVRHPPARRDHSMAYDSTRDRVVLFGGLGPTGSLSDTWEWDGTSWALQNPVVSPPAGGNHVMVYDSGRQRVVVYGGTGTANRDPWEWDGTSWTQLTLVSRPTLRTAHGMAYDAARQRIVMAGGLPNRRETWVLGPTVAAANQTYGIGCAGSGGTPRIVGYGRGRLGNSCFAIDVFTAQPNAPVFLLIATAPVSVPFGPCTLLVDARVGVFIPASSNSAGFASVRMPVPYIPRLTGGIVHAQGLVLHPAGGWLSLAFSNGLKITLGE